MTAAENSTAERFSPPSSALTIEFFVGLFMLIGVGCLAYLAVSVAGMRIFDSGHYEVIAEFDNVSGLEPGAPVEIAGVPIGEVRKITLSETNASVSLRIRDDVPIRADDIASIRTKGIIGDRYIRISPGASTETIKSGQSLRDTESAVDIEEIVGKLIHRME